jgi:hypothetical protein
MNIEGEFIFLPVAGAFVKGPFSYSLGWRHEVHVNKKPQ